MGELDVCPADNFDGFHDVVRIFLEFLLKFRRDGQHGCRAEGISGVHAHSINIFNETDRDHLVLGVPDNLQFEFFPAQHRLFNQDLVDDTGRKTPGRNCSKLLDIIHQSSPCSTHAVCRPNYNRIAKLIRNHLRVFHTIDRLTFRHFNAKAIHGLLESSAILPAFNGVDVHADDLNAVFIQDASFVKL